MRETYCGKHDSCAGDRRVDSPYVCRTYALNAALNAALRALTGYEVKQLIAIEKKPRRTLLKL